ncbi:hypothetical protein H702_07205 [Streptococcus equinus JB1]|uniref:Uncharacterized protein n=1 Tax=Streptococcus equinus JB1 TaxID=1294274 RepID=A0A091BRV7_STREI|nr:hypothetical protein H702_07205 [Streptococcus equinus JB1]SFL15882.1 hypothetical protein SAMN02910290_00687 [Streptococcus equinus JB1]
MIDFPLYVISNGYTELPVEDPDLLKELVIHILETNKEITIRREK